VLRERFTGEEDEYESMVDISSQKRMMQLKDNLVLILINNTWASGILLNYKGCKSLNNL